ncbi:MULTISPECIES: LysE family transporter [Clostridium]|uniref:LysE family transporter n=1 Tax=Clostridium senegalense TaxID=1465809 RepID=A0A6M0H5H8_9CLOT|nr:MULTISPECIES: LysE family transporter [Clostridium]NEU05889.1 LysE family transporter [Clostridium senegalense]
MFLKGLKFGMLLQLAIGPVCIFILQMASLKGFYVAETGVLGVTIVDGLYIFAAILGIASIIEKRKVKVGLKIFGAIILIIFGLSTVLGQFGINFIPSLSLQGAGNSNSVFLKSIILTASNPLTIVFWAGVFSTKIIEENMKRKDIYIFGIGALMATLSFLTLVVVLGTFTKIFLPAYVIQILNIIVGVLLIYFGVKMALKKV